MTAVLPHPATVPTVDPDAIRDAIRHTDERAKLLRRLLRASLKLQLHLTNTEQQPTRTTAVTVPPQAEVAGAR